MREIQNRISYGRSTLGAELVEGCRCSVCRQDAWVRLNIDGVWSYLCTGCWAKLTEFVSSPLRSAERP